jgi:hypothetical protein
VKRSAVSGPTFVWLTVVALLDPPSWPDLAFAVVAAGVLHVAYFLTLQGGYRAGDVSVVYPLARGTGPLLPVLFAPPTRCGMHVP